MDIDEGLSTEANAGGEPGADGFLLQRRLIRLGNLLINRRAADLRGHGLTSSQSAALLYFAAHPGSSCRDLSNRLQTSHQAVQKSVSRLQDKGLLRTSVSSEDARTHPVFATPEGARLADELRGHGEDAGNEVFAQLDVAERRELADMVDRMIAGLEEASTTRGSRSSSRGASGGRRTGSPSVPAEARGVDLRDDLMSGDAR